MGIGTKTDAHTFESRTGDGLHAVVLRAAKAVAEDELDSGGLLDIVPDDQGPGDPRLDIGAAFSDDGLRRTIAQLDVHVTSAVERTEESLLRDALTQFGGLAYTNLCLGSPRAAPDPESLEALEMVRPSQDDALDVTVTFETSVPFVAKNVALTAARMTDEDRETAVACLRKLGVRCRASKGRLPVSRWQLRGRMSLAAQIAAFLEGERRGANVSIYAATLPTTQSVRIARRLGAADAGARSVLDVTLSRGLAKTEGTTKEQATTIEAFLTSHLGVSFPERRWRVTSRKWMALPEREERNPILFSRRKDLSR